MPYSGGQVAHDIEYRSKSELEKIKGRESATLAYILNLSRIIHSLIFTMNYSKISLSDLQLVEVWVNEWLESHSLIENKSSTAGEKFNRIYSARAVAVESSSDEEIASLIICFVPILGFSIGEDTLNYYDDFSKFTMQFWIDAKHSHYIDTADLTRGKARLREKVLSGGIGIDVGSSQHAMSLDNQSDSNEQYNSHMKSGISSLDIERALVIFILFVGIVIVMCSSISFLISLFSGTLIVSPVRLVGFLVGCFALRLAFVWRLESNG